MENKKNTLLLIDGSSLAFRAFFALYNQVDRFVAPSGLHTNAIYGFHLMLNNLVERLNPNHVLIAFDAGKTTFRTEMFSAYKDGRARTPDEFREQLPFIKELIEKLGYNHYELKNYEADDIIGTLDKMAELPEAGDYDVTIVTGDKDLIQLADSNTTVEISKKGVAEFESFTPTYLMEKTGLTPEQFIDLKGLMGDSSDNYPGVTKVGEKTALKLLQEWGSIDNLYENIDSLKKSKMKENLIADREMAFLSRTLATIDTKSPIEIDLADTLIKPVDTAELIKFYDEMGFAQFKAKLETAEADEVSLSFKVVEDATDILVDKDDFFYIEILNENYHKEDIIGFAWGNEEKVFVSKNTELLKNFPFPENTYDFKKNKVLLHRLGIELPTAKYDSMLAKYLISTTEDNKVETIGRLFANKYISTDEEVYGKGAKRRIPEDEILFKHLAGKIHVLATTKAVMIQNLEENEQYHLLTEMELPLANVLAKMEIAGIAAEVSTLEEIGAANQKLIADLTEKIYELAGEEFNINSPKQLGVILFEKLQLPHGKKTKTGYSTAADILENLAQDYELVAKILEYRQISKIQSTYVQGLIPQIAEDGRIHTRYVQDLTQTGRLSSIDPNLQNIPVRLEAGRLIRKAFVAAEDNILLSSDYSQIELRVLAHMSKDEHLIDAFNHGADIHSSTAMRVFNIDKPENVTPNDRRNAKAVNFGISYGETEYGLAKRLSISNKEAAEMIQAYFERYPGVANYIAETKREAKDKGYVSTMFNRRRKLPEINNRNFMVRQGAERQAINAPIQGSAGDILKIAMINLDAALSEGKFKAKLLLQVHDEIILEVPKEELAAVQNLVKQTMESAVELNVPLLADENTGDSWYEAK
ncbi:DNA polymerase I [Lactococcus formosensis]|jgi:DNA polymerase I|uniref:DNA polymerase I n=4 Tax=Lactococcus formosensis TaxID=1281486 RepID=A0A9X4P8Z8_9LACT|nr:DNA polymerase I [Lactococcus formosensis]MDG6127293.1 DNA polymerase I [Lactococcus formosensis]MDG6133584.1 DNA polymerase I [Lactococcus formosensis]MDG6135538.1 DNA polymerase I [Lactococcus formosensis]MDG6141662.1 DNA polymerase I [Lactococcus formosensis]MDG6143820.1 DNA polymerase I [Lactococcus formosensis]